MDNEEIIMRASVLMMGLSEEKNLKQKPKPKPKPRTDVEQLALEEKLRYMFSHQAFIKR